MTSRLGIGAALCVTRLVAVVVLVTSVVSPAAAQSPLPRFERADCLVDGAWARGIQRECGWLLVPESRDSASARTVRLAVEIFRARDPNGAPPRVLLHGGPGGPGGIRQYSEGVARSLLFLHHDVVIYDQRGAGLSEPAICPAYDSVAEGAQNLRSEAARERALSGARHACMAELKTQGINRLDYSTAASVADLIDLRRALGYESWDIYGVSYGARLAQEAMARDGHAIRAVVLASPVARNFSSQAEQPLSTQHALERVFAACARQPSCRDAFPHVEQDYYAVYDDLLTSPVPVPVVRPSGGRDTVWLDGTRLVDEIRNRLVDEPRVGVSRLPLLIHELRAGDRERAAREFVGTGATPPRLVGRALRELINCADRATAGAAYRKTLDSVNAVARSPFRRARDQECDDWLGSSQEGAMPVPVHSDIPTLILVGHFDDRTPATQARRIASTLSRASLVEFPDEGHDTRPGRCHAGIVMEFLEDPTRQVDISCIAAIPPITFATTWEPAEQR
ncbi:MAG TPA: alpha/beta fold hydrolase [Gemmatimonadales bacterium]|nr:alpha/beta fold hydrolase [Gemmatimonadales bacterium]